MHASIVDVPGQEVASRLSPKSLCTGQLVGITAAGRALVDYAGNACGPVEAHSLISIPIDSFDDFDTLPVLLFFDGQSSGPIIMGVVRDTIRDTIPDATESVEPLPSAGTVMAGPGREVVMDGKTLQFDAHQEIVLRCGKSSLTLRRDGKIVLKGTEIVSRASETNKIKGSMVKIN